MKGMEKVLIVSKKWKDIKTGLYTAAAILIPTGFGMFQQAPDPVNKVIGLMAMVVGGMCFWVAQHTNGANGNDPKNPLGKSP